MAAGAGFSKAGMNTLYALNRTRIGANRGARG